MWKNSQQLETRRQQNVGLLYGYFSHIFFFCWAHGWAYFKRINLHFLTIILLVHRIWYASAKQKSVCTNFVGMFPRWRRETLLLHRRRRWWARWLQARKLWRQWTQWCQCNKCSVLRQNTRSSLCLWTLNKSFLSFFLSFFFFFFFFFLCVCVCVFVCA